MLVTERRFGVSLAVRGCEPDKSNVSYPADTLSCK